MPEAPAAVPPEALDALARTWGYAAFRAGQDAAVAAAMAGRDTLAVLPTGGGKSLVYQVPAVARRTLTLVVSPLLALMHDQADALARRNVPAVVVHGGLAAREADQVWTNAEFGQYRVLYCTPERLQTDLFRARAARLPVALLAVDEAHCISEWGHDFRPAYRRIAEARPLLETRGPVPVVAVTATATPDVRRDIVERLGLRDPAVVVSGFDRPNLLWAVRHVEDKVRPAAEALRAAGGAGLVYAGTRRGTERWAADLLRAGVRAEAYHAGLAPERRAAVQVRWLGGKTPVLAATSAFGMGIDKPDVRAVVHVALPPTLEAYQQEAGRAGRDGRPADALLLVSPDDDRLPRHFAETGHPTAAEVQAVYAAAGSLAQVAIGSLPDGPTTLDAARLASVAGVPERTARTAASRLAEAGAWTVEVADETLVRVDGAPEALRSFADAAAPRVAAFVEALLRTLPRDAFHDWTPVRLEPLAEAAGLPVPRVEAGLAFLAGQRLLGVQPAGRGLRLTWAHARTRHAALDAHALEQGRRRALTRLDDVTGYVRSTGCRRQHLLAHFGEASPARCGHCDVCLGALRPQTVTPADEPDLRALLGHVARGEPCEAWLPGARAERRDALVDWLAHEGYVRLADPLAVRYEITPRGQRCLR